MLYKMRLLPLKTFQPNVLRHLSQKNLILEIKQFPILVKQLKMVIGQLMNMSKKFCLFALIMLTAFAQSD